MAFIKDKERESLIKRINRSYGFRKVLISIEILGLIGFIIVVLLQGAQIITTPYIETTTEGAKKLTGFGIGMVVYAALLAVFGIISLLLVFTLKSPKTITKNVNRLESSARSGKKNQKNSAANYRDRTKSKKEDGK